MRIFQKQHLYQADREKASCVWNKTKAKKPGQEENSELVPPERLERGRGGGRRQSEGGQGQSEPGKAWKVGGDPPKHLKLKNHFIQLRSERPIWALGMQNG